ncbi:uncharacterized protein [Littorina saxatilis]|uniref:uncharacterized protein isoform X2 n=1 Tax=Littorina saxatilis TaxID=31220 RepID=UPI0038B5D84D
MSYLLTCAIYFISCFSHCAHSAPCCAPKQWAAEDYYWVSYDLDRQQIAVITFDSKSDFYRRELLDYKKGMHYVTPDELNCSASPLSGTMKQFCVPPAGGNITLDVRMFFGLYPDPNRRRGVRRHAQHFSGIVSDFRRKTTNNPRQRRRPRGHQIVNDNSPGMYAETIYYETSDVIGYVTVTSQTCNFVSEMTYTTMDDGRLVWQHTQWNNLTETVEPESFQMPKSCYLVGTPHSLIHPGGKARRSGGVLANILSLFDF